jgi:uncharacterized membrane protein YoaK (UPF0700 family)
MTNTVPALRPRVAITLAAIGGWVDAVGFLVLFGLFTAHLSGNTARFGVALGQGELSTALTYAVPLVVFFAAVVVGVAYITGRADQRPRALGVLLAVEAALLVVFMVAGTALRDAGDLTPHSLAYYGLAVAAVAAMGLQTAAMRHAAGVPVHTTFITGMVTSLAEEVVLAARSDRQDSGRRARVHGGLVGGYVLGAVGGSALEGAWALWALSIPLAVLGLLIVTVGRDPAQ